MYIYVIRFHTGDIIEMVGDKNFKIIDRIKNFFKLSQVNVVCHVVVVCKLTSYHCIAIYTVAIHFKFHYIVCLIFLNQAHTDLWLVHAWFFETILLHSTCMCESALRLLITRGMMWCDVDLI